VTIYILLIRKNANKFIFNKMLILYFPKASNLMKHKISCFILLVVTTISACQKNSNNDTNNNAASTADVYLCGEVTTPPYDEWSGAIYWKNGVAVNLKNPNPNHINSLFAVAGARAIAVNSGDVYVSGYGQEITHPETSKYVVFPEAMFWKNGVVTKLSSLPSEGNAIAVNGSDVYVAGLLYTNAVNGSYHAVYWKNGVLVNLPDSASLSSASGIAVSDGDVYVTGTIAGNAIYWKNGTIHSLGGNKSSFNGIKISNNYVYMVGSVALNSESNVATYWKNNVPVTLAAQSASSSASAIAIVGTDVYVAGVTSSKAYERGTPVYWKNGAVHSLPGLGVSSCIAVNGQDVYVGGTYYMADETSILYPRFWKNATSSDLTINRGQVTGIAVVSH
jgi:hypothetical protein